MNELFRIINKSLKQFLAAHGIESTRANSIPMFSVLQNILISDDDGKGNYGDCETCTSEFHKILKNTGLSPVEEKPSEGEYRDFGDDIVYFYFREVFRKFSEKVTTKITVTLEVETQATEAVMKAALEKGIHYGLDVKGVAAPKDIKICSFDFETEKKMPKPKETGEGYKAKDIHGNLFAFNWGEDDTLSIFNPFSQKWVEVSTKDYEIVNLEYVKG